MTKKPGRQSQRSHGQSTRHRGPPPASMLLCGLLLTACAGSIRHPAAHDCPASRLLPAMGTHWLFTVDLPCSPGSDPVANFNLVAHEIDRLEHVWSTYRPDSETSRINQGAGDWQPVTADTAALLTSAMRIHELTGGAFDPTVGPLMHLWRFTADAAPPPLEDIETARQRVGLDRVRFRSAPQTELLLPAGMRLDFGGIAKGAAAGQVCALLARWFDRVAVDAGGDIVVHTAPGAEPWNITLRNPLDRTAPGTRIILANGAVMTSGTTERFFFHQGRRYHHIIDPRTGWPPPGLLACTVIGPNAAAADALATALIVMGPAAGTALIESLPGWSCRMLLEDGSIIRSSGFPQEITGD
ncbi:FAD:protein FMN transferase [bacterium]|nr:FAD:protein FMN transferase [candidate division CSSED10-310 bacterium]